MTLGLAGTFGLGYACADGLGLNASYTQYFGFPWRNHRHKWLELRWKSALYDDVPEPGTRYTFHSAEFHAREFLPGFLAITAASALLTSLAYRMATRD